MPKAPRIKMLEVLKHFKAALEDARARHDLAALLPFYSLDYIAHMVSQPDQLKAAEVCRRRSCLST